ncbi:MAG: ketoacyl-ACP synthase III [Saprospiraceae bacterium]|nr:ketoacyl-ACP synthase III [Saprospiraceae bacterium]
MQQATIISTGMSVPEQIISNEYFNNLYGEDVDSWLKEHVQIYNRRWCSNKESTADLAVSAGRKAIENGGISPSEIDLIIVATDTPEYISPATSAIVQHRLGANNSGTFDLNAACAGFVTALDVAAKYLRSDHRYHYILVIGAYAMSKYLNLHDKKTATLFADGAGAILLHGREDKNTGWQTSYLKTEGKYSDYMGIYGGGTKNPFNERVLSQHLHQLQFVQKFPKSINPDTWTEIILQMAGELDISPKEVDHFFITQINIYSIWDTLDRLKIDRGKAYTIMHDYGYTGSACIPMALHDAVEKNRIKKGDLIFFIGSGGGLAFAGAAFRY